MTMILTLSARAIGAACRHRFHQGMMAEIEMEEVFEALLTHEY